MGDEYRSSDAKVLDLIQKGGTLATGSGPLELAIDAKPVQNVRETLNSLADSAVLDVETKGKIGSRVRQCIALVAAAQTQTPKTRRLASGVATAIFAGLSVAVFFLPLMWLHLGSTWWEWSSILLNLIVAFVVGGTILTAPILLYRLFYGNSFHFVVYWLLFVAISFIVAFVQAVLAANVRAPDAIMLFVLADTLWMSIFSVYLLGVVLEVWIAPAVYQWRTNTAIPDAIIVNDLALVLQDVERHPEKWIDLSARRDWLARLENVADRIEQDIPRQLRSGDAATDEWMRKTMRQMAAALRAKKKWLLTPKADTRQHFMRAIAQSLVHAATGDWDSFEKIELPASTLSWPARAANLALTLLKSAFPLLALLVIQRVYPAFNALVGDYALSGAILWFVVSLIASLDPQYKDKLAGAGEALNLLGGKK